VAEVGSGDDEPEHITDLDVGVTRIASDTVRVIGNVLCVPFDSGPH
jgi:hypothetical protein